MDLTSGRTSPFRGISFLLLRAPALRLLAALVACSDAPAATAPGSAPTPSSPSPGQQTLAPQCSDDGIVAAPDGAGDACRCGAPCSLDAARDAARGRLAGAAGDVVVQLRGGTYRLAAPFALDASHSGQNGHSLVFRALPGERPVLDGAIQVKGFTLVDVNRNIYAAPVPKGIQSRQLFVNGRRATRARGPVQPSGFGKTANGFALGDAAIANWPDRNYLEVFGTRDWKAFRCPVAAVSNGELVVAQPCWSATQAQSGVTFDTLGWLENALELLDEGGEFFLDGAGGYLYYAPRAGEDIQTADVELPVVEEILHIEGTPAAPAHDIAFEGIGFRHATWLAPSSNDGYAPAQAGVRQVGAALVRSPGNVVLRGTHQVRLSDCRFEHLGAAGISIDVGAAGNTVERAWLEDISGSAVVVGDVTHVEDHHPADPALIVRDNTVTGSYVTRAGAEYFDAPGIFVGYTTHTTVAKNELFDLPYTGISVGWGWGGVDPGNGEYDTPTTSQQNRIENNIISHHMRTLRDGGGIYVLGAQNGSVMQGNYIEEQAAPFGNLYLDNGSRFWTVQNNAVLLHSNLESGADTPERSYWLFVQVNPRVATSNTITGNYANDPKPFEPIPMDPSNTVTGTTTIGGDLAPIAPLVAAAGSPLRSPEIARGKPVAASSTYDASHTAAAANDGNAFNGWSPTSDDPNAWWSVDLGADYDVDAVEVVSRWEYDQPETRRSYRVIGSTDPAFTKPTVLGSVDGTGLHHREIYGAVVAPPARVRYVRVEKTAPGYFFLGEVRVHGRGP